MSNEIVRKCIVKKLELRPAYGKSTRQDDLLEVGLDVDDIGTDRERQDPDRWVFNSFLVENTAENRKRFTLGRPMTITITPGE